MVAGSNPPQGKQAGGEKQPAREKRRRKIAVEGRGGAGLFEWGAIEMEGEREREKWTKSIEPLLLHV